MAQMQCKYGLFEVSGNRGHAAESLRLYGEFAERQLVTMLRFVEPHSVVVDIGADVGARAVALARYVQNAGRVHALEMRGEVADILKANVARNFLQDAVAVQEVSEEAAGSSGAALWGAFESEELPAVDLVHVGRGVAVSPSMMFGPASGTVRRCRPVICIDLANVQDGEAWLAAAKRERYTVFGHVAFAFNPENYRCYTENVYGDACDRMLILVPDGDGARFDTQDLLAVASPENLGDVSQNPPAQTGGTSSPAISGHLAPWTPMRETAAATIDNSFIPPYEVVCSKSELHIVVPFYKKEELVPQLFNSLNAISDELRRLDAKVFFYNDSPDYAPLQAALEGCCFDDPAISFEVITNESNQGFIGTCNRAFARAKAARAAVVLLNSDTIVFPGALSEMLDVAALDPMIGFVSPRSNNATIATLPYSSLDQDVAPQRGYAAFLQTASTLPRYSFVPTAVGFCLLIKWTVHSELGGFDPVYGTGYNEENDLVMRANRCGYSAVLANRAFVWHMGEQSFAESSRAKAAREAKNAPVLHARYPEYPQLVHAYFASPEFRAETLIEYAGGKDGQLVYAFDFSSFGPYFNGTFESGIKLLEAAVRTWPRHCKIAVYMQKAAWDFHGLARFEGVARLEVDGQSEKVTAIVRIGQPFDVDAMSRLVNRAPVVGIFMLDTIAYDCGYLSLNFDARIWHFALRHIDVLFTNSRFTLDRITNRFAIGPAVIQKVSPHSLDIREYGSPVEKRDEDESHIFVIGNHFNHKFVRPTVDAIAAAFPNERIVAVGYGDKPSPHANVKAFQAGHLSDEEFEKFYSNACAVVFPSHYEGFGFPVLHALARRRPIYVRDSALYRELAAGTEGAENIHFFCTMEDLISDIRDNGMHWTTPRTTGERGGWDRSAREVFASMEEARRTVRYGTLVNRLRQFDQLRLALSGGGNVAPTPGKWVGMRVDAGVQRVLRVPGMKPLARRCWHLARRLRNRRRGNQ
ncbi:MAG: glycosyltransferase [Paraburkholderia tropica]|uniref:GT2 family glycosyltransferase n=1 Tax=Paraburkholderia tropica TaxID=92647 RepID=A0ABX5MZ85_9BURK|nr:glycosyltransferase [Paraburkholderia tropica]MBB2997690.1 GT2 family glycosyltransferase [Paraburkholderia tropica]MBB6316712.1 GT2 family glycosyltransferase [Paraburkholderia tropica]PXX20852.1 GT2 family glycosyltransferase [Paraburkholderia tropica]PZW89929.1 GT2 family glycosyltransferase [Paraburkholderia tropica]